MLNYVYKPADILNSSCTKDATTVTSLAITGLDVSMFSLQLPVI